MRILHSKATTKLAWRFRSGSSIWRVFPTDAGLIAGEERDPGARKTTFFCLNRRSGEVKWRDRSFKEDWWIGVEGVWRGLLFLHRFAIPDMPWHKGIIAVSLESGTQLWENSESTFAGVDNDLIVAFEGIPGSEQFLALDPETGGEVKRFTQQWRPAGTGLTVPDALFPEPGPVPADALCGMHQPGGPVEWVAAKEHSILTRCIQLRTGEEPPLHYRQQIAVIRRSDGSVLFEDTIAENTAGLISDAFFVQGEMMYYLKDRASLNALNLLSM